jgi:hypothetical protein
MPNISIIANIPIKIFLMFFIIKRTSLIKLNSRRPAQKAAADYSAGQRPALSTL